MPHSTNNGSHSGRILIIDDEKRVREGCRAVLEEQGYHVMLAESGDAGVHMIEQSHFDVVLLDLMMPGLSGFEVMSHVKTIHPETVIIVITGHATLEHSIEAMKKGALDFLPKPFSPDQLKTTVYKAIEFTQALQDIATEKSRIRTLINHMSDGVLATDTHKHIVLANPAFQRMVGYHGPRPIGLPVGELTRHTGLKDMIDQVLVSEANGIEELAEELEDLGPDDIKVYSAKCLRFTDRSRRVIGSITLLRDITALKEIDRLKSDFVSMVSHELRGPLNAVLAQIKVMGDGLAGPVSSHQKEMLDRVSQKLLALADMTSELLDLARIEAGLTVMEKEAVDLSQLLQEQVSFHRSAAAARGITVQLGSLSNIPPLMLNRRNMEEVFANLITNALKYSPDSGIITLTAERNGDYLRVSIQDTGFGIPEAEQPHIFERFYRVKNADTRMITGTGLGLAIVKSILDSHNGMIRLESTLGKGSTFHVYLPLNPSDIYST